MRKIITLLCLLVAFMLPTFALPNVMHNAYALDSKEAIVFDAKNYLEDYSCHGNDPMMNVDRVAGTAGEARARNQELLPRLNALGTNVTPVNNDTTVDGVQSFVYDSINLNKRANSANVIYVIKGADSSKKIVLTCNYDNYFEPYLKRTDLIVRADEAYSEGVNASAASVAMLLSFAANLPKETYDFDIELVFFGAGYDGNAGANYYLQTMGKVERARTLLIVDISRIAFGEDVYYYFGEFGSKHEQAYAKCGLAKYSSGKSGASIDADNALGYENAGYSGATVLFAEAGLNFMHIFAGSYSEGVFGGICEYYGKENVLNTSKDNLDYISTNKLEANLRKVSGAICDFLAQSGLTEEFATTDGTKVLKFFANKAIFSWAGLVVLFVLLLISVLVHYGITKKTYDYASKNDIAGVMITLDEEDKQDRE